MSEFEKAREVAVNKYLALHKFKNTIDSAIDFVQGSDWAREWFEQQPPKCQTYEVECETLGLLCEKLGIDCSCCYDKEDLINLISGKFTEAKTNTQEKEL